MLTVPMGFGKPGFGCLDGVEKHCSWVRRRLYRKNEGYSIGSLHLWLSIKKLSSSLAVVRAYSKGK